MNGLDEKTTDRLVEGLLDVLGEKVIRLVLYGSVARGSSRMGSDK